MKIPSTSIALGLLLASGCASSRSSKVSDFERGVLDFRAYYQERLDERLRDIQAFRERGETPPPYLAQPDQDISNFEDQLPVLQLPSANVENEPYPYSVLLIHGLTATPLSMKSIADAIDESGRYPRVAILLDGHASDPAKLTFRHKGRIRLENWRRTVDRGLDIARKLGRKVIVAGHSLGGALAIDAALRHQGDETVAGLLLFSPAIRLKPVPGAELSSSEILWGRLKFDYAEEFTHRKKLPEDSPYGYVNTGLLGVFLTARLGEEIRTKLSSYAFARPVFSAVSEADSVIDPPAIKEFFSTLATKRKRTLYRPTPATPPFLSVDDDGWRRVATFPKGAELGHSSTIIRPGDFIGYNVSSSLLGRFGKVLQPAYFETYSAAIRSFLRERFPSF